MRARKTFVRGKAIEFKCFHFLIEMQYSKYGDEDAVAALQAITMYFLLRISEDNEDVTNFDVPLIYTMIVRQSLCLFTNKE